jgi:hypothetical protein
VVRVELQLEGKRLVLAGVRPEGRPALAEGDGDLVDAVLDRLPEGRVRNVVIFDPADAEWPVGFNILRAHFDIERNLLASDFVAIFERLSSSWGDQMTAVLGNAAMAFLYSAEGGTLVDLKRFLIEKGFRERLLRTVSDPEVRYFWTREFPLLRGTTQASLLTRLNGFLRHRLVRNMVSQRGERFDVARMMDEGKVVLAPLSQGLIGQENSWLLGSLLVSRSHQAALSRQAVEESRRRPFFLYLDEAHNFLTPSIAAILSGARKYGLGLVLAHQELGQFPAREDGILDAVLAKLPHAGLLPARRQGREAAGGRVRALRRGGLPAAGHRRGDLPRRPKRRGLQPRMQSRSAAVRGLGGPTGGGGRELPEDLRRAPRGA